MNKHIKLICLFVILLSIVVVGVALLTMANKNKEVENRITSFMLETAGNNGEYHIENIKQLSEKTYAVVQWIPDSGDGKVYLIELGREEIDFIKKEMPLSMGVAVYKEIFSGNTIVFGAVSDKVWKDFDSEPEQVNFTKVEILYSGGKEQETVNNFSGFLFCIPGEKYIDDVLFYSGDEVIAKLSDLPLGENVVENFNR